MTKSLTFYKKYYGELLCWNNFACRFLGVSKSRIHDYVKDGDLTPHRDSCGQFLYFRLKELIKLRNKRISLKNKNHKIKSVPSEEDVITLIDAALKNPQRNLLLASYKPFKEKKDVH